jgi:hypothetical protein
MLNPVGKWSQLMFLLIAFPLAIIEDLYFLIAMYVFWQKRENIFPFIAGGIGSFNCVKCLFSAIFDIFKGH